MGTLDFLFAIHSEGMAVFNEDGLRNFKDFLTIYNQMSELCFNRCVINLNSRKLSGEEEACTDVCVGKQMMSNNRAMGAFAVEQPLATEKKMEEATAEAEATVAKLKEQGVDTDNMSPQQIAEEAFKAR